MPFSCDGCSTEFARHGDLIQHLQKSTRLACVAERTKLEASMRRPTRRDAHRRHRRSSTARTASNSPGAVPSDSEIEENREPGGLFEGDFFGNVNEYADEDFPFPNEEGAVEVDLEAADAAPVGVDEVSDEESDADGEDAVGADAVQPGWEPPRVQANPQLTRVSPPPIPMPQPALAVPAPMQVDVLDENPQAPAAAEPAAPGGLHPDVHNQLREAPVYIQHFGQQAGAPIIPTANELGRDSGYRAYTATVDGAGSNPYAPFASQMDWEVARWAKLRGSGSTAFSDLLAIEGVCRLLL